MSAFVTDKFHIDVLVDLAMNNHRRWGDFAWYTTNDTGQRICREAHEVGGNAIGQMLLDEMVRSVSYRYNEVPAGDLPGPIAQYWNEPYVWQRPRHHLIAVQGLKAIRCYEYQSCETPDFEDSEAFAFCKSLESQLINDLPGYEDAPWEWQAETLSAEGFRVHA